MYEKFFKMNFDVVFVDVQKTFIQLYGVCKCGLQSAYTFHWTTADEYCGFYKICGYKNGLRYTSARVEDGSISLLDGDELVNIKFAIEKTDDRPLIYNALNNRQCITQLWSTGKAGINKKDFFILGKESIQYGGYSVPLEDSQQSKISDEFLGEYHIPSKILTTCGTKTKYGFGIIDGVMCVWAGNFAQTVHKKDATEVTDTDKKRIKDFALRFSKFCKSCVVSVCEFTFSDPSYSSKYLASWGGVVEKPVVLRRENAKSIWHIELQKGDVKSVFEVYPLFATEKRNFTIDFNALKKNPEKPELAIIG